MLRLRLTTAVLLAWSCASPAVGLPDLVQPTEPTPRAASGAFDREGIAAARAEIEANLTSSTDPDLGALLRQQLAELDRAGQLLDVGESPEAPPTFDPPFSLRDLDRTLERLRALTERRATLQDAVNSAERALERATRVMDDTRRRAATEEVDRGSVRPATERVRLARFQLRNARSELAIAADATERLGRAAGEKRQRLKLLPDDLTERVDKLTQRREELIAAREPLTTRVERARADWESTRTDGSSEERASALQSELNRLERDAAILDGEAASLTATIEAWTLRYRLAAGKLQTSEEEVAAKRQLAAQISELSHDRDLARAQLERLRAEIVLVEGERDRASEADRIRWLDERLRTLTRALESERSYLATLQTHLGDQRRWLDEFAADGVAESVQEGVNAVRDRAWAAWNFEITNVDDRPITAGKLILALVLILVGIFVSRILARQLRRRVLDRLSMDPSLAANLQTLTLYLLILLFFLIALSFVSIPLTALTFIGGALAIGIGFGSQNIVNNFISGLILMAERPIKVGDLIEVGGTYGRVERIGGRSTRVKSGDNTHIIVPNSTFLEREVLNWTLSDRTIRTSVDVGVAYGSPTRETSKLMARATEDHGKILKKPTPEVLFMAFGDSALEFRVYFWIQVHGVLDQLRIQSDVRHKIDHLFRDAGITIAFPQRDVHLDLGQPLDVRLRRDDPVGKETGDA